MRDEVADDVQAGNREQQADDQQDEDRERYEAVAKPPRLIRFGDLLRFGE